MNPIKTIKWRGRRYTIVQELETSLCVNLHEDEIYGFQSRMIIPKEGKFWKALTGKAFPK